VLDRLVGPDRAAEGEALLGVLHGHLERRLDGAERLGGQQRLRQVPRARELLVGDRQPPAGRALERDVGQRARRVVAGNRLDARRRGLDRAHHRRAGIVDPDDDQQVGALRVGHPGDLAGEGDRVPVNRGARWRSAVLAHARVDRPALDEVARRARRQPRRPHVAGGHGLQRLVAGRLQQRAGGQQSEQRHRCEHAAALLRHEHRVERAEARAPVLLVDQQPRPAGLDRGRPEVRQLAASECLARGLDGLDTRQRAACGLAQELLLV
jgi:hypothetical protein